VVRGRGYSLNLDRLVVLEAQRLEQSSPDRFNHAADNAEALRDGLQDSRRTIYPSAGHRPWDSPRANLLLMKRTLQRFTT
jgi:hypothetical protein